MASQTALKKQFGFIKGSKSCGTCKYIMEPDASTDIFCKKTGILIENETTGVGNETLTHICNEWVKQK